MSGALSHDIMGGGVRAFRLSAIAIGIVMTALGLAVLNISINVLVGWAFAIAASTFCPLLLLGIWWRRFTWIGAIGGLILGGLASSVAVLLTIWASASSGWPAVLLSEPAIWTVPLAFLTMIVLSLATPARSRPTSPNSCWRSTCPSGSACRRGRPGARRSARLRGPDGARSPRR